MRVKTPRHLIDHILNLVNAATCRRAVLDQLGNDHQPRRRFHRHCPMRGSQQHPRDALVGITHKQKTAVQASGIARSLRPIKGARDPLSQHFGLLNAARNAVQPLKGEAEHFALAAPAINAKLTPIMQ